MGGACGDVRGVVFFGEVRGEVGIGEAGVLPSHSGVGLKFLEPKLLIRIDQVNMSCAIYAQLKKDPLKSTSGVTFSIHCNIECLVVIFGLPWVSYLNILQIIILQEFHYSAFV